MAATMSCPKCDQPLVKTTTNHGVFWRCENCRGTAIGLQALRRTFARDEINAVWRRAREKQGAPAAACPSCRNQMIEVAATAQPEPRIEVCRICHFLWFDADELAAFAPLPTTPEALEQQMPAKAREALALAEVEMMGRAAHREKEASDEVWLQVARMLMWLP